MNRVLLSVGGVAAAIVLIVGGGILFGWDAGGLVGGQPSPTATPTPATITTYEAVFVRRDPSTDILVIGVDSQGRERVITRLPNAWNLPISRSTPAPAGVVSSSGLLAMAAGVNFGEVRWTVFDLLRPEETPILIQGFPEQDIDQLDYFLVGDRSTGRDARPWWGPGDRLAIYWYERIPQGGNGFGRNYFVTFADGRTGEAAAVDIPDSLGFLPYWAPDGSGIFAATVSGPQLLRPDGTLAPASDPVPEADCDPLLGSDYQVACVSPDEALTASTSGNVSFPAGSVTTQATGERFEVTGSFAGWLRRDQ